MTTRYEIRKATSELGYLRHGERIENYVVGDAYTNDQSPTIIETFTSKKKALEALNEYRCKAYYTESTLGKLLCAEEYFLQESQYEYDEHYDEEYLDTAQILTFALYEDADGHLWHSYAADGMTV